MIKNISEIIFIKKSPFNNGDFFQIEIGNNVLKFSDNRYFDSIQRPKIITINHNLVVEFLDKFFRIIADWKVSYVKNDSFDVIEWSLLVKFKDGKDKIYYGNLYPDNFDALEKLKYKIIDSVARSNI